MGTYKKLVGVLSVLVIAIFIVRFVNHSDANNAIYQIYKADNDEQFKLLYKFFRKPPWKYKGKFVEKITKNDKVEIIELTDTLCPFKYNYLYVHFNKTNHKGFLYAPPHFRLRENYTLDERNYISSLVNMSLFQEYARTIGEYNHDSILGILTGFIGKSLSNNVFVEVASRTDLSKLFEKYPLRHPFFEPTIEVNKVDFDFSSRNRYFWFNGGGLLKITTTDNNTISIKSIGFLGNETVIM